MSEIELDIVDHVATITLNRPPVNSLSASLMRDLIKALKKVDESKEAHVAILTGAGRCFSAGVDLKEQLAALEGEYEGPGSLGPQLYDALLNSTKPTIAAINGPALGAGVSIAASCCILVMTESGYFGLPEIDVGMLGGARHAMRLLGHSTVNRMLLTGHQLNAQELYLRRVVEACVPDSQLTTYAHSIAVEIASKNPTAIRMARHSLAQIEDMGVLQGYCYEKELAEELGRTPEAREAMRNFLERRRN